jgi:zona occludens toxin (predicted ATPase)
LQKKFGITTTSFALVGAMVGGRVAKVTTETALVVEEKMTFMLLLIFLLFLRLYCNYDNNNNTSNTNNTSSSNNTSSNNNTNNNKNPRNSKLRKICCFQH